MKRPNLLYLLVLLQCAIGIGLAAVFVRLQQDLDEHRQVQAELYRGQIALSDQITDAQMDITFEIIARDHEIVDQLLHALSRDATPTKEVCTTSDRRRVTYEENLGPPECAIITYEKYIENVRCTKGGTVTREYIQDATSPNQIGRENAFC